MCIRDRYGPAGTDYCIQQPGESTQTHRESKINQLAQDKTINIHSKYSDVNVSSNSIRVYTDILKTHDQQIRCVIVPSWRVQGWLFKSHQLGLENIVCIGHSVADHSQTNLLFLKTNLTHFYVVLVIGF